jgi:hypothetical protein
VLTPLLYDSWVAAVYDLHMQMLLDDQVVKTQAMRASPFIKPLETAALSWEKLLLAAQVRHIHLDGDSVKVQVRV